MVEVCVSVCWKYVCVCVFAHVCVCLCACVCVGLCVRSREGQRDRESVFALGAGAPVMVRKRGKNIYENSPTTHRCLHKRALYHGHINSNDNAAFYIYAQQPESGGKPTGALRTSCSPT